KPDEPERNRREQHDPDETIRQIRPQERARAHRDENERTAYRGRTGLRQMRLRPVVAHALTDLIRRQRTNHPGTDDQRNDERRQRRENRAQRQVAEHAKRGFDVGQALRKVIEHGCYGRGAWGLGLGLFVCVVSLASAAATRSSLFAREPLMSTTTPS